MIRLNNKWFLGASVAALTLSSAVAGNPGTNSGQYILDNGQVVMTNPGQYVTNPGQYVQDESAYQRASDGTLIYAPFNMTGKGRSKVQKQINKDYRRVLRQDMRDYRRALKEERKALRREARSLRNAQAPESFITSGAYVSPFANNGYSNGSYSNGGVVYNGNSGVTNSGQYILDNGQVVMTNPGQYVTNPGQHVVKHVAQPGTGYYSHQTTPYYSSNPVVGEAGYYVIDANGNLVPYGSESVVTNKPVQNPDVVYDPNITNNNQVVIKNGGKIVVIKPQNQAAQEQTQEQIVVTPGTNNQQVVTKNGGTIVVTKPSVSPIVSDTTVNVNRRRSFWDRLCGKDPCNTNKEQRRLDRTNRSISKLEQKLANKKGDKAVLEGTIKAKQELCDKAKQELCDDEKSQQNKDEVSQRTISLLKAVKDVNKAPTDEDKKQNDGTKKDENPSDETQIQGSPREEEAKEQGLSSGATL